MSGRKKKKNEQPERVSEIRIGAKVSRTVVIYGANSADRTEKVQEGTVIYIHPRGRFYTVDFGRGIRQCYRFVEEADGDQKNKNDGSAGNPVGY